MEPQQAHQILTNATSALELTRADHVVIQRALDTLKPKEEKKAKK